MEMNLIVKQYLLIHLSHRNAMVLKLVVQSTRNSFLPSDLGEKNQVDNWFFELVSANLRLLAVLTNHMEGGTVVKSRGTVHIKKLAFSAPIVGSNPIVQCQLVLLYQFIILK